ncbi:MAG: MarR family transcriptional regulator [Clostridia bacterium]|nr:MarR family transcriptional regulator [Clostridia bacterium]
MKKKYECPARPPERAELSNNPIMMCHEISHLSRARVRELNDTDDSAAPRGTRLVLSFLATGDGVTQQELVRATHLRAPTVSVILKNLEDGGFVERRRDSSDMRSHRVYLTERGRELDRKNIEKIKLVDSLGLTGLDAAETEQLMSLLGKIRNNLLCEKSEKEGAENK